MAREDLAGVEGDDRDLLLIDDGAGVRPPEPRLEVVEAAIPVPPQEAVQVPAADPVSAAAAVTDNCDETTLRTATRCFDMRATVTHVPTHLSPIRCRLCPGLRHCRARHSNLVRQRDC